MKVIWVPTRLVSELARKALTAKQRPDARRKDVKTRGPRWRRVHLEETGERPVVDVCEFIEGKRDDWTEG